MGSPSRRRLNQQADTRLNKQNFPVQGLVSLLGHNWRRQHKPKRKRLMTMSFKKTSAFAVLALVGSVSLAQASDLCAVAESDRQPIDALKTELEAKGWEVRNIKVEDGCYEAYAIDDQGRRVEAYFDPQTFAAVKSKVEG
jgi:hypothetical protein